MISTLVIAGEIVTHPGIIPAANASSAKKSSIVSSSKLSLTIGIVVQRGPMFVDVKIKSFGVGVGM